MRESDKLGFLGRRCLGTPFLSDEALLFVPSPRVAGQFRHAKECKERSLTTRRVAFRAPVRLKSSERTAPGSLMPRVRQSFARCFDTLVLTDLRPRRRWVPETGMRAIDGFSPTLLDARPDVTKKRLGRNQQEYLVSTSYAGGLVKRLGYRRAQLAKPRGNLGQSKFANFGPLSNSHPAVPTCVER